MEKNRAEERRLAVIRTLNAARQLLVASTTAVDELRSEIEGAANRIAARRRGAMRAGRLGGRKGPKAARRRVRVSRRLKSVLEELDLPTRSEIEALNRRLDELSARLDERAEG